MRFPPFAYPRAEMQARVIARLDGGYPLRALCGLEGYPSSRTIYRWAAQDPGFARQIAYARAWGRGIRGEAAARRTAYDEARAEALLLKVRQGHAVRDLVRRPEGPNRERLNDWKRQRPEFAAALVEAARFSASLRRHRWAPYDEATADRLVLRVSQGEALRDIVKEPQAPSRETVERWRRAEPGFAAALKTAALSGLRRKMGGRRRSTPAVIAKVAAHIRRGGSLRSASRLKDVPHRVTLYGWMRTRPEFAREVEAAKRERDARLLDEGLEIAERTTPETVAADRARFAALRQRFGQLSAGRKRGGSP